MSRKEIDELRIRLINLEDFQKFIDEHKILSSKDLQKRFNFVYNWILLKNFSREIIYYGKTESFSVRDRKIKDSLENFNYAKDFQDYINLRNIESISQLKKDNPYIYRRLLSLGIKDQLIFKKEKFPEVYWLYKKFNTLKDFQELININKITSRIDFIGKMGKAFDNLFCSLGFNELVIYFGSNKRPKIRQIPSSDEVKTLQDFINDNKIKDYFELRKKVGRKQFDEKILKNGILPYVHYFGKPFRSIKINPEDFNTFEKVQKYISENKIKNLSDLNFKIRTLIQIRDFSKNIKFFSEEKQPDPSNEEEFNSFVKENKITGSADFYSRFRRLYLKAKGLGININYYGKNVFIKDKYKTLKSFQDLIDKENIVNPADFKARFPTIYQYLSDNKFCGMVKYKNEDIKRSNLERDVETFLESKNIEFIARQQHPFLSNHKSLDVLITKYNIGIECQGDFHFVSVDYYGGDEQFKKVKERDLEKYNECKSKGITLLYYADPTYMKWGYMKEILSSIPNYIDKVYLNLDDLWKRIQEIIEEKEINNELFSEEIMKETANEVL